MSRKGPESYELKQSREDLRRLRKRIKKVVTINVTEVSRQELTTLSCLVMTARGQKLLKQEEKP